LQLYAGICNQIAALQFVIMNFELYILSEKYLCGLCVAVFPSETAEGGAGFAHFAVKCI